MISRTAVANDSKLNWEDFKQALTPTVLVAALGYFVDIYDLLLFRVVREPSLASLGIADADRLSVAVTLDNFQQAGLLVGGVLWGTLGDKRGRLSVLYGSILMYSVANLLNASVTNIPMYQALRFVAGVGLAGELGAAITLVSEVLSPRARGYGTTIVASVGVCGAVVAALVAKLTSWQTAYLVGGGLGLSLLVLRVKLSESGMFEKAASHEGRVSRGNFFALFQDPNRAARYAACILVAIPIWYVVGLLMSYGDRLAPLVGVSGAVTTADCILWGYAGLAVGDLTSGLVSQQLGSRRRAMAAFMSIVAVANGLYFVAMHGMPPGVFLGLCFVLGLGAGYWAMFMQATAEQFGTNLRATATTTASNFVRATVIPMGLAMKALAPSYGLDKSVALVGGVVAVGAIAGLLILEETFGKDLAFEEE